MRRPDWLPHKHAFSAFQPECVCKINKQAGQWSGWEVQGRLRLYLFGFSESGSRFVIQQELYEFRSGPRPSCVLSEKHINIRIYEYVLSVFKFPYIFIDRSRPKQRYWWANFKGADFILQRLSPDRITSRPSRPLWVRHPRKHDVSPRIASSRRQKSVSKATDKQIRGCNDLPQSEFGNGTLALRSNLREFSLLDGIPRQKVFLCELGNVAKSQSWSNDLKLYSPIRK